MLGRLALATVLLCACAGDDEGADAGTGASPECGGCAIPFCGNPGPCDCACIEGAVLSSGGRLLACTAAGCFGPVEADSGSTADASGMDEGNAGASGSSATDAGRETSTDGGLLDGSADAAVEPPDASDTDSSPPVEGCASIDVQNVRNPADGCRFELNVVVRLGQECEGQVTLDGTALTCNAANGWRMADESTVELTGAACTALQSSSAAVVDVDFPCRVVVEML